MSDQSPTQGITCAHDSLLPELAGARARRTAVPPVVWRFLQDAWRQACKDRRNKPSKGAKQQRSHLSAVASIGDDASDRYLDFVISDHTILPTECLPCVFQPLYCRRCHDA